MTPQGTNNNNNRKFWPRAEIYFDKFHVRVEVFLRRGYIKSLYVWSFSKLFDFVSRGNIEIMEPFFKQFWQHGMFFKEASSRS